MKKHIFLVDNDNATIKMFSAALSELGTTYKCTCAENASHAVSILQYITPDVIISNNRNPEINGLQLLEEIKKINRLATVPFYLYASGVNQELQSKVVSLGGNGCIEKPKSIFRLMQVLQRLFRQAITSSRFFK
ncbi:MAG TPA: response regulator [Chitinophagaceae bacterium]